jgi:uncharacterized damage-inducible protein DinB
LLLLEERMHEFFEAYYDRLQSLHKDIAKSISGLSTEALDWIPGPGMNSLAVLVAHLTGAERYWIGDVAAQDPSGRVRASEFKIQGWEAADLQTRLDQTLVYAQCIKDSCGAESSEPPHNPH